MLMGASPAFTEFPLSVPRWCDRMVSSPGEHRKEVGKRHACAKKGRNCMEDPEESGHERDQAAKAYLVMLMQMGYSWQQAQTQAGLCISKSTAYRLLQAVQTWGEAAVQDGRHGHPAKLREAVLQWLLATCRAEPQMPSRVVQAALQEQFGIHVSIGHLNRTRVQLGIGNHVGRLKKNGKRPVLHRRLSGKRELVDFFLLLLHRKRVCCQR
jgi:transposase